MTGSADRNPRFVDAILDWRWTWFLARLALVSAYLLGGISKLLDWRLALAEMAHFGLHPPALFAIATLTVELVGSALLLAGRWVWLAAGMLSVFTTLAAIIANPFWTMQQGQERFMATNAFFEHLGLIGGFVLTALIAQQGRRRPAP
jgi:uncharacterized membrane protein YphA (DoxX/SURF4 family)